jgi:hypothetical protein
VFSSIQELSEKLEAAKYVTDPVTLKVIYLTRLRLRPTRCISLALEHRA